MKVNTKKRLSSALMGVALICGFTLAIDLFLWSVAQDTVNPSLNIDRTTDVLSLVGKPGETVDFDIHFNPLDEQYWRSSSGVDIVINGQKQSVVTMRDQQWPETITVNSNTKQLTTIPAKYAISPDAKVGENFTGQLERTISYPTAGNGGFRTNEVQLHNSVELQIVAVGGYAESRRKVAATELWIAIAAGIVMLMSWISSEIIKRN